MARGLVTLALVAALGALPAPARAADPLKPLRTLVYDVTVSIGLVRHSARAGIGGTGTSVSGRKQGSQLGGTPVGARAVRGVDDANGTTVKAEGTIAVDVVMATGDGGLVLDIMESASVRTRPKVRIVVSGDGTVLYDRLHADDVSEEEVTLARWLARGFYRDRPRETGVTWTVDQSSDGLFSAEHYRVLATDDARVTLNYALEQKSSKAEAFMQQRTGELVYDTVNVVPLHVTYAGDTRRQLFDISDETHTAVVMKLTADSFAKKP